MQLSKSDYMLFLRHPAWLWLKKHDKSRLPPVDAALQALFDQGTVFEKYAEQLFPDAVHLGFNGYNEYVSLTERTTQALRDGAKTILQGRFEADTITCIVDVLDRNDDGTYDLYEIKASTSVKPEHKHDLAFQTIVLESAGLTINRVKVICVNNEYVRAGEVDLHGITKVTDVTDEIRTIIDETKKNIQKALQIVASKKPPSLSPRHVGLGAMKDWIAIYKSIYTTIEPYSIYDLCSLSESLVGELEDLGITHIKDIPDHVTLSAKQQRQRDAARLNQRIIDTEKITQFVEQITYPLYFLDYETFGSSIPPFDGLKPYQQVPFQYSLHILESPTAELKHKEYLHRENSHSGLPLLKQLKKDIGETGTVFVWYEPFEKGRNTEMGSMFPEHSPFMQKLNDRIIDLMTPFSEGWFVDQGFLGSASIKKVLPILVEELSYKNLAIQEGGSAQRIWMEAILDGRSNDQKEQILLDLIEYCKLDTLAMVELFNVLRKDISVWASR